MNPTSTVRALALFVAVAAAATTTLSHAATPVAVWDGYFGDDARAKGAYTLHFAANKLADDASSLTITNTVGVKVDFSNSIDGNSGFTLMFRYENMTLGATNTLATTYYKGQHDNRLGVYLDAQNNPRPIWQNRVNSSAMQTQVAMEKTSGVIALTYKYANGTKLYSISSGERTTLFACSGLRGQNDKIDGCAIGGMRNSANGLRASDGMKITAIAIFDGELTESEMTDYTFPGAGKLTATITEDTTVSALNATYGACADFFINVADGVTVNMDEPFEASFVRFSSEGSIRLKSVIPPKSSETVKIDLNGVIGSCVRSWLNPCIVGFNFNSSQGNDCSAALATGEWFSDSASASGSAALSYVDGLAAKITWSASGRYQDGVSNPSMLSGYLDDNSSRQPRITVSGVPYEMYDVIIYCSTDSQNFKFSAKRVNDKLYTWDSVNNTTVETADENASWGASRTTTPVLGTNALRVNGLTGALTIEGGIYSNTTTLRSRSCIAAIQIMQTGTSSGNNEFVIDATDGLEISDATIKDSIRSSYGNVRIDGDGENGVLLDFGSTSASISSHIVFNGGKHILKYSGNASSVNLGANSTAPIFEVANGAEVDFYQHDLTGWSGAQIVSTTDIRIDAGTVMNLYPYGSGTTYYRGRYTLEPGATLTSYFSEVVNGGSTFRMHGGAVQGSEQIYVPASTNGSVSAVINGAAESNGKIHIHDDTTVGFGIFVGENSTLDFDLGITSYNSNAPIGKWGDGTLNLNGDLSGYQGTFAIHEGTVFVSTATTLGSVTVDEGATLAYSYDAKPTISFGSIVAGTIIVDVSSLVSGGVIESGTYQIAPAGVPAYRVVVTGLPENSGFSVSATVDGGIVLSDRDIFSPEWTGASGTWSATQFNGKTGSTDGLDVSFSQGTPPLSEVTVTVDGEKSVKSASFVAKDTEYTLTGDKITAANGVVVGSVAPVTIYNAIDGAVAINAGSELTLAGEGAVLQDGKLSGSGTLVLDPGKGNTYTMSLTNTSYTGEAVIKSGTVKMGGATSFGNAGRSSVIRVRNNATLDTNGASSTHYGSEKNWVVLEEGATFTSSVANNKDKRKFACTSITLEGDAVVDASIVDVGIAHDWDYQPTHLVLNEYTLIKIGDYDFRVSAVENISGTGVLDIRKGSVSICNSYYNNRRASLDSGTLRVAAGAYFKMNQIAGYGGTFNPVFSVKNLELNGAVTRDSTDSTLTVTGYITGSGTTPMLTLAEGAVIKPAARGCLKITDSLITASEDGTVTIDISGVDFTSRISVPLFRVGSAEMLPEPSKISFNGEIPEGWELAKMPTGYGYRLRKPIGFAIRLR